MSTHHYAFCPKWFKKHQYKLLFLLNKSFTRSIFRFILKIDCNSVINYIWPNYFTYWAKINWDSVEIKTEFSSHNKYSKILYNSFKYLWWSMHFLDWLFIDKYIPKLSFWFSTLTVYPDSPAVTTCAGYVLVNWQNSTLSTIRSAAWNGSSVSNSFENIDLIASSTSNQYGTLTRHIATFDTSALWSWATINNSTLSLYWSTKWNWLWDADIHIAWATPASNNALVNSDYWQCQTTSFSSISYASYSTSSYNDFSLNSSWLANISKTWISKFSVQTNWDINNSFTWIWASLWRTNLWFRWSWATWTANDPKLLVTYNLVISNSNFFMFF